MKYLGLVIGLSVIPCMAQATDTQHAHCSDLTRAINADDTDTINDFSDFVVHNWVDLDQDEQKRGNKVLFKNAPRDLGAIMLNSLVDGCATHGNMTLHDAVSFQYHATRRVLKMND